MDYGWMIVNVALPVVLPLALLFVVNLRKPVSVFDTVKDGQLCWIAPRPDFVLGYAMAGRYKPLDKDQISSIILLTMLAISVALLIAVVSFVLSHLMVAILVIASVVGLGWLASVWLRNP